MFDISRLMHICSISSDFFKLKQTKEDCLKFIPVPSSINQVFVVHSFTTLHRLAQLCFMQVVLDSRNSLKWVITSLNRLCGLEHQISKPAYIHTNSNRWKLLYRLKSFVIHQDIERNCKTINDLEICANHTCEIILQHCKTKSCCEV